MMANACQEKRKPPASIDRRSERGEGLVSITGHGRHSSAGEPRGVPRDRASPAATGRGQSSWDNSQEPPDRRLRANRERAVPVVTADSARGDAAARFAVGLADRLVDRDGDRRRAARLRHRALGLALAGTGARRRRAACASRALDARDRRGSAVRPRRRAAGRRQQRAGDIAGRHEAPRRLRRSGRRRLRIVSTSRSWPDPRQGGRRNCERRDSGRSAAERRAHPRSRRSA